MKKIFTFSLAALGIMVGGLLSSCSQDDMPQINDSGSVLVKAPKIVAYSGDTYFGNDTRSGEDAVIKPKPVTGDEMKAIREKFNAIDNHFIDNYSGEIEGVHLYNGFYDFNTQWLKDGEDFYVVNIVNGESNSLANKDLRIWHQDLAYDLSENTYNSGKFTTLPYVDQFLNYEQYNPQIHIEDVILDLSFNDYNTFVFATNPLYVPDRNNYNKYDNHPPFRYVTIDGMERDEHWEYAYIALYWQECQEGQPNSPGSQKGDNKWDRVIRIAKRIPCNECNHPEHEEGSCDICADLNLKNSCNPNYDRDADENENTPDLEIGDRHDNEVEVNLHGVERKSGDLDSHLSIHLRHAGDVEIFIPVPRQYTVDKDDLLIAMKHEENHMIHSASYTLKDSENSPYGELTVSITVSYEEDGIYITTHGVTEDVIAWCNEKWNDGITFEVWNYYNEPEKVEELPNGPIRLEDLQYLLNKATIRFVGDSYPEYYINAIKDAANDCTVTIVDDQAGAFGDPREGQHLNDSELNKIYELKE